MDISQAVTLRRSVRAFKNDPVPKDILAHILEEALRAPSWANVQPWELAVASGEKLAELRRRYSELKGENIKPDVPHMFKFPEPYASRSGATIAKSHASVNIKRDDKEMRAWWEQRQLNNFDAPSEIYVYTDRSLCQADGNNYIWPFFDCGALTGLIGMLAVNYNLGTIIQARAVVYPDIIREVLAIPDTKIMVIGIGIGYPDTDSPLNQYSTDRVTVDELVTWHGY